MNYKTTKGVDLGEIANRHDVDATEDGERDATT